MIMIYDFTFNGTNEMLLIHDRIITKIDITKSMSHL